MKKFFMILAAAAAAAACTVDDTMYYNRTSSGLENLCYTMISETTEITVQMMQEQVMDGIDINSEDFHIKGGQNQIFVTREGDYEYSVTGYSDYLPFSMKLSCTPSDYADGYVWRCSGLTGTYKESSGYKATIETVGEVRYDWEPRYSFSSGISYSLEPTGDFVVETFSVEGRKIDKCSLSITSGNTYSFLWEQVN